MYCDAPCAKPNGLLRESAADEYAADEGGVQTGGGRRRAEGERGDLGLAGAADKGSTRVMGSGRPAGRALGLLLLSL